MTNFKPADIILTQGHTLFSRIILWVLRRFQDDPVNFNHTLMVCKGNLGIEADKKIRHIDLEKRLKKTKAYKVIRRFDLTGEQRENIVKEAETCLGQRYGYRRLFRQLFDQLFNTNWFTRKLKFKRHICSTLVCWSYSIVTDITFNNISWKSVEPDDISDEADKHPELYMTIIRRN